MAARLRCAIYTRKSSEEGLEQSFNSLHAQREACEAYVLSQAGEGWTALKDTYDDGGYSGGSMERPGLAKLLADIAAGKIDVVVVYKVDRLTRALADFAKIVEAFDARGVSFVSVTQAFNTTTSMGRLTLNVLLSFAQFEREVTGERIRDKIAASKAKGMWMGGIPPLGYDAPTDLATRALVINEAEAAVVRQVFSGYLQAASAKDLVEQLAIAGVRSKAWTTRQGKVLGGVTMRRGAIYHILQSRIYLGEIVHKGNVYPGQHQAIVSRDLFEAVAAKLASQAIRRRDRPIRATTGPLTGLLFDANGKPMSPSFAYGKGGKLYRYYIAMALQVGVTPESDNSLRRVSAPAVESFLVDTLRRLSCRADLEVYDISRLVIRVELRNDETHLVLSPAAVFPGEHPKLILSKICQRLREGEQAVTEQGAVAGLRLVLPQRLKLRGGRTVITGAADEPRGLINPGIVQVLKRAHAELLELKASPLTRPDDMSEATAPATQHDRQVCKLAFLAPELQQEILNGKQPPGLTLRRILKSEMPLAWADQKAWLDTISRA
ncbi:MAG: recombinase family protein [Phenylobacterium sp.]|jgi:DNA invertase Pin-like site-specific DNA recombinase